MVLWLESINKAWTNYVIWNAAYHGKQFKMSILQQVPLFILLHIQTVKSSKRSIHLQPAFFQRDLTKIWYNFWFSFQWGCCRGGRQPTVLQYDNNSTKLLFVKRAKCDLTKSSYGNATIGSEMKGWSTNENCVGKVFNGPIKLSFCH